MKRFYNELSKKAFYHIIIRVPEHMKGQDGFAFEDKDNVFVLQEGHGILGGMQGCFVKIGKDLGDRIMSFGVSGRRGGGPVPAIPTPSLIFPPFSKL